MAPGDSIRLVTELPVLDDKIRNDLHGQSFKGKRFSNNIVLTNLVQGTEILVYRFPSTQTILLHFYYRDIY